MCYLHGIGIEIPKDAGRNERQDTSTQKQIPIEYQN